MDLADAALRERAREVLQACSLVSKGDSTPSITDCVEVCVSDLLDAVEAACALTRDAARAEQREEIAGLREALGVMGANADDAHEEARAEVQRARAEQREQDAKIADAEQQRWQKAPYSPSASCYESEARQIAAAIRAQGVSHE